MFPDSKVTLWKMATKLAHTGPYRRAHTLTNYLSCYWLNVLTRYEKDVGILAHNLGLSRK